MVASLTRRGFLLAAVPAIKMTPSRHGVSLETSRVRVGFPHNGIDTDAMRAFTQLVHQGLLDIESYLSVRFDADYFGREKIFYRVSSRVGMSSAHGSFVRFPLRRVDSRSAPYLHETTHVLMEPIGKGRPPTWLTDGFASFVESHVAETYGGYDAGVFTRGGNRTVDEEARGHLNTTDGRRVEPFVRRSEEPPNLRRDRERTAPPYYVLSHSFVKFLVGEVGSSLVAALHGERDLSAGLRRETGRDTAKWKAAWLEEIAKKPKGVSESKEKPRASPADARIHIRASFPARRPRSSRLLLR